MWREEVYVETSVWNFLLAENEPLRRKATETFFAETPRQGLYISNEVLLEIDRAPGPKRGRLLKLITDKQPTVLPENDEVLTLAAEYVNRNIVPVKFRADAVHIAYASVSSLTAIVSWNFEHIVKVKTRREVRAINTVLGYAVPEIATPEEYVGGV
jgi:hypothetical protein